MVKELTWEEEEQNTETTNNWDETSYSSTDPAIVIADTVNGKKLVEMITTFEHIMVGPRNEDMPSGDTIAKVMAAKRDIDT
jgi:hypothetical protein